MKNDQENSSSSLVNIETINVPCDFKIVDKLIKKIKTAFCVMDLNPDNKLFFYKRVDEKVSRMGIQLASGDFQNPDNYIIFERIHTSYGEGFGRSTISMHIPSSVSYDGQMLVNLINNDIIHFFDYMEDEAFASSPLDSVDIVRAISKISETERQSVFTRFKNKFKKSKDTK